MLIEWLSLKVADRLLPGDTGCGFGCLMEQVLNKYRLLLLPTALRSLVLYCDCGSGLSWCGCGERNEGV